TMSDAASESQFLTFVQSQPDLFDAPFTTVVPQEPFVAVEDRKRLVNGVVVPLVDSGTYDRVGRMALPVGDAVPGPGDADLGFVLVEKADVEHQIPVTLSGDLAGRDSILLPGILRIGLEDRIILVPGPFHTVCAGGVPDRVGLVLFAPGVPHAEVLGLVVVD